MDQKVPGDQEVSAEKLDPEDPEDSKDPEDHVGSEDLKDQGAQKDSEGLKEKQDLVDQEVNILFIYRNCMLVCLLYVYDNVLQTFNLHHVYTVPGDFLSDTESLQCKNV